jgi:hypothetical protein
LNLTKTFLQGYEKPKTKKRTQKCSKHTECELWSKKHFSAILKNCKKTFLIFSNPTSLIFIENMAKIDFQAHFLENWPSKKIRMASDLVFFLQKWTERKKLVQKNHFLL